MKTSTISFPNAFKGKYRRLYEYLCHGRAISPEVVTDMVKRDYLYEDDRHNLIMMALQNMGLNVQP